MPEGFRAFVGDGQEGGLGFSAREAGGGGGGGQGNTDGDQEQRQVVEIRKMATESCCEEELSKKTGKPEDYLCEGGCTSQS